MLVDSKFSKRLSRLRNEHNLEQIDIIYQLKSKYGISISRATYQKWEYDPPRAGKIEKALPALAKILDVTLYYLKYGQQSPGIEDLTKAKEYIDRYLSKVEEA